MNADSLYTIATICFITSAIFFAVAIFFMVIGIRKKKSKIVWKRKTLSSKQEEEDYDMDETLADPLDETIEDSPSFVRKTEVSWDVSEEDMEEYDTALMTDPRAPVWFCIREEVLVVHD